MVDKQPDNIFMSASVLFKILIIGNKSSSAEDYQSTRFCSIFNTPLQFKSNKFAGYQLLACFTRVENSVDPDQLAS